MKEVLLSKTSDNLTYVNMQKAAYLNGGKVGDFSVYYNELLKDTFDNLTYINMEKVAYLKGGRVGDLSVYNNELLKSDGCKLHNVSGITDVYFNLEKKSIILVELNPMDMDLTAYRIRSKNVVYIQCDGQPIKKEDKYGNYIVLNSNITKAVVCLDLTDINTLNLRLHNEKISLNLSKILLAPNNLFIEEDTKSTTITGKIVLSL